ncbi:MAG TPA: FAD-dependent oxidoreductase, partial [Verrucomicrobiota bacterium]|nr:FAD-dependent oxidoreductase [Verrucomicrobiota bacterium]
AKVVIDSTGNADIAAAAGTKCKYTDDTEIAIQGAGLPQREPGSRYINTDFTFIDDSDIVDIWRVFVSARDKFKWAYDLSQLIDTRERRQIVGDYTLTPMDMMLKKTFRDTIVIAKSNFDTHGYTIHPLFFLRPPGREEIAVRVPYRCLLPEGLDGIIVTGLGVSAHRDALPVIRMQPDIQNQGYAAGVAAAMIAKNGVSTRGLDIRELQKHLVEKEILPKSILTEEDSPVLPVSQIADAVQRVTNNYEKLEIILEYQQTSIPLLEKALKSSNDNSARLIYAHILAILGNNAGIDVLIEKIKNSQWDKGWRYTGMGQFGPSLSPLDSYIIAAGKTRDKRALDAILEKAEHLQPSSEFSHFRAVALALEYLNDSRACPVLAKLLQMPGISGNATTDIKTALTKNPPSGTDTTTRNAALTELVLARALYRCGDYQGIGEKVLKQYSQDLHGHYARHAAAVLKSKKM